MLGIKDELCELIRKHVPERRVPDDRLEAALWLLNTGGLVACCRSNFWTEKRGTTAFSSGAKTTLIRAALTDLANTLREQRRVLTRWERYSINLLDFAHLVALCILFRQF